MFSVLLQVCIFSKNSVLKTEFALILVVRVVIMMSKQIRIEIVYHFKKTINE